MDLPHFEVRKELIRTYFQIRQINFGQLNLHELATHSDGFSGRQIEQAIVVALHTAAAHNEILEDAHIIAELGM